SYQAMALKRVSRPTVREGCEIKPSLTIGRLTRRAEFMPLPRRLFRSVRNAKAVLHAVERVDVNAAVGDGEPAPVAPRGDLVAARPQLFAGPGVERVEHGPGRVADAVFRVVVIGETDVETGLIGILAAAVREDDAVSDDRRLGAVHVARDPGRSQRPFAVLLFDFEGGDCAVFDRAVFNRRLEFRMLRPPERRQHPARTFGIFPAGHRAPDARRGEVDLFVADERRAV